MEAAEVRIPLPPNVSGEELRCGLLCGDAAEGRGKHQRDDREHTGIAEIID